MSKKVITIYLADKLNTMLETALHDFQAKLVVCSSEPGAQWALTQSSYCLIVIDTSSLTTERAQNSLVRMRRDTYAPILLLGPERAAQRLLKAGADVCLSPQHPPEGIVAHALALLRRYTLYNHYNVTDPGAAILYRGELIIDPRRHRVTLAGTEIELQRREFRLLVYFARNPGIVLTPEQICEVVWMSDYDYNRDVSSVIASLRRKLKDVHHRPTYIETVYGVGYRFLPEK